MQLAETSLKEFGIDSFPAMPFSQSCKAGFREEDRLNSKAEVTKGKSDRAITDPGKMAENVSKSVQNLNTRLSFSFNKEKNLIVVQIKDQGTNEVIKQMPPEEMVDSLVGISSTEGFLVDRSA